MFTDNSLKAVRQYFHEKLGAQYSPREIDTFYEWTAQDKFDLSKSDMLLADRKFSESELLTFRSVVKQLQAQEPIQYILGASFFLDLKLKVGPGVLCPRPETEELAAMIINDHDQGSLLDIGTGSGAIPLAIKSQRPEMKVTGIDNSMIALEYAEQNAEDLKLDINLIQLDILTEIPKGEFDVVVSNPPYVLESDRKEMSANVLAYEPHEALFVPDEQPLLFYERIAELCNHILAPGGTLYFEIHEAFGSLTEKMLRNYGFTDVSVIKDMYGKDRMVKAKKAPPL